MIMLIEQKRKIVYENEDDNEQIKDKIKIK